RSVGRRPPGCSKATEQRSRISSVSDSRYAGARRGEAGDGIQPILPICYQQKRNIQGVDGPEGAQYGSTNSTHWTKGRRTGACAWSKPRRCRTRGSKGGNAPVRFATVKTPKGPRLHVRGASGYVDVARAAGDERFGDIGAILAGGTD